MTDLSDYTTNTAAAIDAGRLSTEPHRLELGNVYVLSTPQGVQKIDLTGDEYRDKPRRTRRHVTVDDLASFEHYWDAHHDNRSEVYADPKTATITAILDAPTPGQPDWEAHQLILALTHTDAWLAWTAQHNQYVLQRQFAEHVEDRLRDFVTPDGATMLEVAQTLHTTTTASFRSGYRLVDGQRQFAYTEQIEGRAGTTGTLEIPERFTIGVEVFKGDGNAEAITGRLRYRVDGDRLVLGYALEDIEDVRDRAFRLYVDALAGQLAVPIISGAVSKLRS